MRRAALAAALLALLVAAPAAGAAYDPVGSGTTKLVLDPSFLSLLKREGVKLTATPPAKLSGGTVSFPLIAGKLDPLRGAGVLESEGALVFKAGPRSVPIKAPQLKTTQRRAPLAAKVGGSQLKLARARRLTVTRAGFGTKVSAAGLTLSAKLATRLAKKLDRKGAFKEGQPLGRALSRAELETVRVLPAGRATLALDPGFQAKLGSLFVAVNPIFPAERPGEFTLPIAGGEIAPDGGGGRLETEGALELLQQGGGQAFWEAPALELTDHALSAEVELRPAPPYPGKLGRVGLAALSVPAVRSDPAERTVALAGASLGLDAATAQSLEELFAKPQGKAGVFSAGEALGTVSLVAQGQ